MSEKIPYVERVEVWSADQSLRLGLGTHLGEELIHTLRASSPRILLDTNECIYGFECWWREAPGTPKRERFIYQCDKKTRLLEPIGAGIMLCQTDMRFDPGTGVWIEALEYRDYDHRPLVAAAVKAEGKTLYILTEEMNFPRFGE